MTFHSKHFFLFNHPHKCYCDSKTFPLFFLLLFIRYTIVNSSLVFNGYTTIYFLIVISQIYHYLFGYFLEVFH